MLGTGRLGGANMELGERRLLVDEQRIKKFIFGLRHAKADQETVDRIYRFVKLIPEHEFRRVVAYLIVASVSKSGIFEELRKEGVRG